MSKIKIRKRSEKIRKILALPITLIKLLAIRLKIDSLSVNQSLFSIFFRFDRGLMSVAVILFALTSYFNISQNQILGGKDSGDKFGFSLINRGLLSSISSNINSDFYSESVQAQQTNEMESEPNAYLNNIQGNYLLSLTSPSLEPFKNEKRTETITYIVKSGDIPSIIAADFGIQTNTLLWANNLMDNDIIRPNQELLILPIDGVLHKIKQGDTVSGLSKTYKAKEKQIISFNNINADDYLTIGQIIIIPNGKKPALAYRGQTISASNKQIAGYFIMPAAGYNWGALHPTNAVDIANACGTPIYAAANGVISAADSQGWNGGYGIYIKIDHPNKTATLYAHLMRILVKAGSEVNQGDIIGLIGTTGRSTGCHIHFEVYGARNPFIK